jgi:hypothetical protein
MILRVTSLLVLIMIIMDTRAYARTHSRRGSVNRIRQQSTVGEPWPKPQSIVTTLQRLAIRPNKFHFRINETSPSCDLLTNAFVRYYRAIFSPQTYMSHVLGMPSLFPAQSNMRSPKHKIVQENKLSDHSTMPMLDTLTVHLQQSCEQYPSLASNESC